MKHTGLQPAEPAQGFVSPAVLFWVLPHLLNWYTTTYATGEIQQDPWPYQHEACRTEIASQ